MRAALQYWQEEMCPHGDEAAGSYIAPQHLPAPSAEEIGELRERFLPAVVRYAICADTGRDLAIRRLFADPESARRTLKSAQQLATVLLPAGFRSQIT